MEIGVHGEHGVHAPGGVVVARGHDLDHVTIQLLPMAAPIAQERSMPRQNVLNKHVQVFML